MEYLDSHTLDPSNTLIGGVLPSSLYSILKPIDPNGLPLLPPRTVPHSSLDALSSSSSLSLSDGASQFSSLAGSKPSGTSPSLSPSSSPSPYHSHSDALNTDAPWPSFTLDSFSNPFNFFHISSSDTFASRGISVNQKAPKASEVAPIKGSEAARRPHDILMDLLWRWEGFRTFDGGSERISFEISTLASQIRLQQTIIRAGTLVAIKLDQIPNPFRYIRWVSWKRLFDCVAFLGLILNFHFDYIAITSSGD